MKSDTRRERAAGEEAQDEDEQSLLSTRAQWKQRQQRGKGRGAGVSRGTTWRRFRMGRQRATGWALRNSRPGFEKWWSGCRGHRMMLMTVQRGSYCVGHGVRNDGLQRQVAVLGELGKSWDEQLPAGEGIHGGVPSRRAKMGRAAVVPVCRRRGYGTRSTSRDFSTKRARSAKT